MSTASRTTGKPKETKERSTEAPSIAAASKTPRGNGLEYVAIANTVSGRPVAVYVTTSGHGVPVRPSWK